MFDAAEIVRQRLEKYQLQAKKSWGQNFLINQKAYQLIVSACAATIDDTIIEIGAGLGTLTEALLTTNASVVAVEHEPDMCNVLQNELAFYKNFTLLCQDAMTLSVENFSTENQKLIIAGNLPYQISTPLIFKMLAERARIKRMVFMLQKEVADRLMAQPDTEAYGALSAQVQIFANVEKVMVLGPGSFLPPPKVHSTVVRITPLPKPRFEVTSLTDYALTVRTAFSQRRKMLRNTLNTLFSENTEQILQSINIDSKRRAETLSIQEFAAISNLLSAKTLF